jgi:hypothetical protein
MLSENSTTGLISLALLCAVSSSAPSEIVLFDVPRGYLFALLVAEWGSEELLEGMRSPVGLMTFTKRLDFKTFKKCKCFFGTKKGRTWDTPL